MRLTHCITPALGAFLLVANAQAQGVAAPPITADAQSRAASSSVSSKDRQFLRHAARGADYELAIAKLAVDKAGMQDIRQYSQTVVSDHEQLNQQLRQLAQAKGIQLPAQMTKKQEDKLRHLDGLRGAAFDRDYEAEIKRINREDKSDLRREVNTTRDADVKSFAQQMQEADAKHEKMAQSLQSKG